MINLKSLCEERRLLVTFTIISKQTNQTLHDVSLKCNYRKLHCIDLILFLEHDDFNFLSSSTISFLWRIIGDYIVLFFYFKFNSSVISLIKKVRNSDRMGCSKGQIQKNDIQGICCIRENVDTHWVQAQSIQTGESDDPRL